MDKYKFWDFVSWNSRLSRKHTIEDLREVLNNSGFVIVVGRSMYCARIDFEIVLKHAVPDVKIISRIGPNRYLVDETEVRLHSWSDPGATDRLMGLVATIFDIEEIERRLRV